ncbi:MAG: class I SAM-dependent methyltransferase [Candidatus Bipolaricaulia bacterium]
MDPKLYLQMREIEDEHWWFVGRRRIIGRVLSSLDLPEMPHILDVGCGTGGNLPLLSEFGKVTGVEPNDSAAEMTLARQAAKVIKGSLPDDMPFSAQTFDLIVLLDVLEHIDDELSSLMLLKSLLVPNGYLVLTVPAFPFLWSQHDEQNHHKRRYRVSTLAYVIQEAGLKIEYLTYYNTWLFPIAAVVRLARRLFPSKEIGSDMWLPGSLLNKIFQAVFSSESHFIGWARMPFGLSLLAIVRKV